MPVMNWTPPVVGFGWFWPFMGFPYLFVAINNMVRGLQVFPAVDRHHLPRATSNVHAAMGDVFWRCHGFANLGEVYLMAEFTNPCRWNFRVFYFHHFPFFSTKRWTRCATLSPFFSMTRFPIGITLNKLTPSGICTVPASISNTTQPIFSLLRSRYRAYS